MAQGRPGNPITRLKTTGDLKITAGDGVAIAWAIASVVNPERCPPVGDARALLARFAADILEILDDGRDKPVGYFSGISKRWGLTPTSAVQGTAGVGT